MIVGDGTAAPPDRANEYMPSACPGGRPPHAWLADGRSLFDTFHAEWTLLALADRPHEAARFAAEAASVGMDLRVVALPDPDLLARYEAPLALIRPDQIVAWRGSDGSAAARVVRRVLGLETD